MRRENPNVEISNLRERTGERLKAAKVLLREVSAQFRQAVKRKASAKSDAADKLAELLSSPDWSRISLIGFSELAPWTGTGERIAFVPSQWPEVDGSLLCDALEECHRAFVDLDRVYRLALRKLPKAELEELFPEGPPRP
jgi:hypothetical protein